MGFEVFPESKLFRKAQPGGFPYMGVKVLLGKDERDPSKWNCNHLSSMFGNWTFLVMV